VLRGTSGVAVDDPIQEWSSEIFIVLWRGPP